MIEKPAINGRKNNAASNYSLQAPCCDKHKSSKSVCFENLLNLIFHHTHCNTPKRVYEFTGPISSSLHPGNTASFEEMSQRWRAVGNFVFDLACPRFKPQPSRSRKEHVTGYQISSRSIFWKWSAKAWFADNFDKQSSIILTYRWFCVLFGIIKVQGLAFLVFQILMCLYFAEDVRKTSVTLHLIHAWRDQRNPSDEKNFAWTRAVSKR